MKSRDARELRHRRRLRAGQRRAAAGMMTAVGVTQNGARHDCHPFLEEVPETRRWWARGAYVAIFLAVAVPLVSAGLAGTIALVMTDAGAVLVTVAAIYWFLISRGFLRWCALALAVLAPLVVVVLYIQASLLWEMVLSIALAFVALVCARAALRERR